MKHSPTPWSQDSRRRDGADYEVMLDANDKIIFDTANSDAACIESEHSDEFPTYWDEQGRADFAYAMTAVNYHERMIAALKSASDFIAINSKGRELIGLEAAIRDQVFGLLREVAPMPPSDVQPGVSPDTLTPAN